MPLRRGDVVLLDFPFSDGTGTKVRPALIVQGDHDNVRMEATIVALITKNLTRVDAEAAQFLIELNTPIGRDAGLRANSAVVCNHLFTVPQFRIRRTIGHLPAPAMRVIDGCLRTALDLSTDAIGDIAGGLPP
ncbi:MAG: type II toxin-antitoxin system PemK/MazF family toxin [Planctomycetaceae bacterium]|nr:type II toxin-antitoxin system PemK/MazF family toxin [Planctomycetaceae bacterium]